MLNECGLSKDVVTNMKRQNTLPSADKLAFIAQYLEVSIEYLLGLTDDPTPPKKNIAPADLLGYRISQLPPKKRKMIEELTETFEEEISSTPSSVISHTNGAEPVQG